MKVSFCKAWLGALCALLILNAPALAQPTKLTVGYGAVSADQLVLWVGKDAGIFAKNNLDVQIVFFTGGAMAVMAMVSGDTPIIQASGPAVIAAGLAGSEAVVVAGGIVTLDYQLVTQPNIKTIEQLKGDSPIWRRRGLRRAVCAREIRVESAERRYHRASRYDTRTSCGSGEQKGSRHGAGSPNNV